MSLPKKFTTKQFLVKLEEGGDNGIINFRNIDLRHVDMRDRELREKFHEITEYAAKKRQEQPFFIDFTGANISGRDFSGYNLTGVIFSNVNAEHTVFVGADLSDVQFDGANLKDADLRNTKMSYAKLYNASIDGVNFDGANLINAYGLLLSDPDEETIRRLGAVASIRDTKFPPRIENIRDKIESAIEENNSRNKRKNSFFLISEQELVPENDW